MNISSLIEKCRNFTDIVVDGGIQRDLMGFKSSLSQPNVNQNLIVLNDITDKVDTILNTIYQSSIPDDMEIVLPTETNYQFKKKEYIETLNVIKGDKTSPAPQIHNHLVALVNDLVNHINANINNITNLTNVLMPYYKKENDVLEQEHKAVLAVIFKNEKCFKTLPELGKTIKKWNRVFSMLSQLMTSETYKDVEIVSVHDGSVDFLFNFNIDIAIDLTEIVKCGLIALGGYFTYLKTVKPIIETYQGNKKLMDDEEKRKKLLLDNVLESISNEIDKRHQFKKKQDKSINCEGVDKKKEIISRIIAEHLVDGNAVKLLSTEKDEAKQLSVEMKEKNQIVRNGFKTLDATEIKLLEDKHEIKEDIE